MPTYKELLEDERWQTKRQQILNKDLHRCQICFNINHVAEGFSSMCYLSFKREDYAHFDIEYKNEKQNRIAIRTKHKFLSNEFFGYFITKIDQSIHLLAARVPRRIDVEINAINRFCKQLEEKFGREQANKTAATYFKLTENQVTNRNQPDFKSFRWLIVNGLHVHHKYYQQSKLPWEYPDEALTTLCWMCHEKLHSIQTIPAYDECMNLITKMTPCTRCFGADWIPEYKHFHSGICFRCGGARYEELIV